MKILFSSLTIILAMVGTANGHGFGQSFEKVVGNYIIDAGLDALDVVAGEPARFDFVLWDKDRNPIEFTDVWVRIAPKTEALHSLAIFISQSLPPQECLTHFQKPETMS